MAPIDTAAGFFVILASDHTGDQARGLMIALAHIKGVLQVVPMPPNENMTEARERIAKGMKVRVMPIIEKMEN